MICKETIVAVKRITLSFIIITIMVYITRITIVRRVTKAYLIDDERCELRNWSALKVWLHLKL